jgi:peptidoglycan hydrolase CwlO-like protein
MNIQKDINSLRYLIDQMLRKDDKSDKNFKSLKKKLKTGVSKDFIL